MKQEKVEIVVTIGGKEKTLATLKELENGSKRLLSEVKNLTPGTDEFIQKSAELQKVNARLSEVRQEVKGVEAEMKKVGSGFEELGDKANQAQGGVKGLFSGAKEAVTGMLPLGAAAVGAMAVEKVIEFSAASIEAFDAAAQSAARMHQVFVVNGGETEQTMQRLIDQSNELELASNGIFSSAEIQDAQAQLKILGLYGNEIEMLLPKIIDAAAANKVDLASAIDTVGGAMRGEMDSIQNWGIALDANNLTLEDISGGLDKFKGSLDSAANVGTNSFGKMSVMVTDAKEAFGGFLVDAGLAFVDWLKPVGELIAQTWRSAKMFYDIISDLVKPIKDWWTELSKTSPWLEKILYFIKLWANPLELFIAKVKVATVMISHFAAGTVAMVQTVTQQWDSLGDRAGKVLTAISNLIGNAVTDPLNIGAHYEKFKKDFASAGAGIGSSFTDNYNKALSKIQGVAPKEEKTTQTVANRVLSAPKEEKTTEKAVKEAENTQKEVQKTTEKAAKEEENALKQQEERLKRLRESYQKLQIDAEKSTNDATIALISDELDREIAIIRQKKAEELAKISDNEREITENIAISEEERAALLRKYAILRLQIEEKANNEISVKREKASDENLKQVSEEKAKEMELAQKAILAKADLEILAAAKGGKRLETATINKLQLLRDIELSNKEKTEEEKMLITQKYEQEVQKIREESANKQKELDKQVNGAALSLVNGGIDAVSQFSQIAADKQISDAEKVRDKRISELDYERSRNLISEEKYNKEKQKAERAAQIEIAKIRRRQAEIDKAAAITQAAINTAVAVTAGMAAPAVPPFPSAIAAGILGAIQIGLIAAKPLPTFAKGGITRGPSHANGGIHMIDSNTGYKIGEMEGGEPYMILSGNTYSNNKRIVDALLDSSMNYGGRKIFADGGVIGTIPKSNPSTMQTVFVVDTTPVAMEIAKLNANLTQWKNSVQAYITYEQLDNANTDIQNIKNLTNN